MGTGGTISGTGKFLKEKKPDIQIVGVDPVGSLYYDFVKTGRITKPFTYKVEGIGEDFFPTTMNLKIIDDIVRVDDKECFLMTRDLVRLEGLFVGGSGGAAVAGAIKYAQDDRQEGEHPRASSPTARRSTSRRSSTTTGCARTASSTRSRASARCGDLLCASKRQRSSPPIVERQGARRHRDAQAARHQPAPRRRERQAARHRRPRSTCFATSCRGRTRSTRPIAALVESDYATVTPDTKIELLQRVLADAKLAIVIDNEAVVGIVTKIDLIDFLAKRSIGT